MPSDLARDLLDDPRLIALIRFDDVADGPAGDPRLITVPLPQLGGERLFEAWLGERRVTTGFSGDMGYACSDDLLMGHLATREADHGGIEQAARAVYDAAIELVRSSGFPHFLRMWNYIPDINHEERRLERYKSFCIGRHGAFESKGLTSGSLPAATGVGSRSRELLVYFLAAREPGSQVENPRQVSAFNYPPRYGPKSPAFSRAVTKRWGDDTHLYISGTASIVGHESRHGDDLASQLFETLDNMESLIRRAHEKRGVGISTIADLSLLKVYVRRGHDTGRVREHIRARVGESVPSVYLKGDLCRSDLLLELEGLYTGR